MTCPASLLRASSCLLPISGVPGQLPPPPSSPPWESWEKETVSTSATVRRKKRRRQNPSALEKSLKTQAMSFFLLLCLVSVHSLIHSFSPGLFQLCLCLLVLWLAAFIGLLQLQKENHCLDWDVTLSKRHTDRSYLCPRSIIYCIMQTDVEICFCVSVCLRWGVSWAPAVLGHM